MRPEPGSKRRADAALALRIAGATYDDIATTLGYRSPASVASQVERVLARTVTGHARDQQRDLAGRRLERLIRSAWPKAVNPEHPEHLVAIRVVRDLVDRHARLYGLDAPAEIVVHTPTTAEIEQWVASVLASAVSDVVEAEVVETEPVPVDPQVEAITGRALQSMEVCSGVEEEDQEDGEGDAGPAGDGGAGFGFGADEPDF